MEDLGEDFSLEGGERGRTVFRDLLSHALSEGTTPQLSVIPHLTWLTSPFDL